MINISVTPMWFKIQMLCTAWKVSRYGVFSGWMQENTNQKKLRIGHLSRSVASGHVAEIKSRKLKSRSERLLNVLCTNFFWSFDLWLILRFGVISAHYRILFHFYTPFNFRKSLIFWSFQGVQKLNIGFKWVTLFLLLRLL